MDREIKDLAGRILDLCRTAGIRIATAESCTGGLVAGALTAIPGASDVVDHGFVTYSNDSKTRLLGVPPELIAAEGAVSEAVARAMAQGVLARSANAAQIAIGVTGVAGPGSDDSAKPAGLVHFAVARRGEETRSARHAFGDIGRGQVRQAAVAEALKLLVRSLKS